MSRFPPLPEGADEPVLSTLCTSPLASTTRLRYQCELITPMYGGGVEPGKVDEGMPIRATAIRGQLRFWWRILFGATEDSIKTKNNAASMFDREREIWGGLGDKADDVTSSRIALRVSSLEYSPKDIFPAATLKSKGTGAEQTHQTEWASQLSDKEGFKYALFAALGKCDRRTGEHDAENPEPGTLLSACRWRLEVSLAPKRKDAPGSIELSELTYQVKESIRWWAAFGGVGARTRRGLGAVKVFPADSSTPLFVGVDEVEKEEGELFLLGSPFQTSQAPHELNKVLESFKNFRQGPTDSDLGFGRKRQGEEATKRPAGRSRWPEADLVRTATNKWFGKQQPLQHKVRGREVGTPHDHAPNYTGQAIYPRAHFGLPLIIHFADRKDGDPDDVTILPLRQLPDGSAEIAERMASPVVIRPSVTQEGTCQVALLVLPQAPTTITCQIKGRDVDMRRLPSATGAVSTGDPKTIQKPAWLEPITALSDYLSKRNGPPAHGENRGPASWGKVRVQRNRANRTLTAQHSDTPKSASASGDAADALLTTLPPDIRQKLVDRGSYHLLVTVKNGEIVKLEPAP